MTRLGVILMPGGVKLMPTGIIDHAIQVKLIATGIIVDAYRYDR
jgi:hypothetical protein